MSKNIIYHSADEDFNIPDYVSVVICDTPPSKNRNLFLPKCQIGQTLCVKILFESANSYIIRGNKIDNVRNGIYVLDYGFECVMLKCVAEDEWVIISKY